MHARVEHLLSLRDGEPVDAAVRVHVAACERCGAELAQLARQRDQLRSLPAVEPAGVAGGWPAVLARKAEREATERTSRRVARVAVAASVAVIGVALGWRLVGPDSGPTDASIAALTPLTAEQALAHDRVAQLQSQSAALEEMLTVLGARPAVERAGTALPIDTLEAQVQWIDHQLLADADARDEEQLWRERVQAMNSLVRLRFVEAQHLAAM